MSAPAAPLIGHIALLSLISFGGMPTVLPDLHDFLVAHGPLKDEDFANCFAIVQALPGPNMILMISLIGWKIGGVPAAIGSALAGFVPSCTLAFATFRVWERFRAAAWQRRLRRGLVPVMIGLVIAGGYVMAQPGRAGWTSIALTLGAAGLMFGGRVNPLLIMIAGGLLGAAGIL